MLLSSNHLENRNGTSCYSLPPASTSVSTLSAVPGSLNTIKSNFLFVCFLGWLAAPDLAGDMKASAGPRGGQDLGAAAVMLLSLN